jgi:cytochrome bd ubiquinol oxidase subunit I
MHYLATIMVALGANLSIFWILSANSWLQTPAGGEFINGNFVVSDYFQAIFNPFMLNSVLHMFFATLETSLFVIGGISAWYIVRQRHTEFFSLSLKIVLAIAIAVTPLQLYIGHLSGEQVYHHQPTKLAAMEAQWETIPAGTSPSWSALAIPNDKKEQNDWEISIPGLLSYILEIRHQLSEPVLGLKDFAPKDRPHQIGLIYYAFRIMIAIGFYLAGLMAITTLQWLRGKLSSEKITQQGWLLTAWVWSAPLGYLAVESGWIVRCVGRQPWAVYGEIRTVDAVSQLPASNVLTSLISFTAVYSLLFIFTLYFGSRIIKEGPNLNLPIPGENTTKETPAEHIPDSRPVEAKQ